MLLVLFLCQQHGWGVKALGLWFTWSQFKTYLCHSVVSLGKTFYDTFSCLVDFCSLMFWKDKRVVKSSELVDKEGVVSRGGHILLSICDHSENNRYRKWEQMFIEGYLKMRPLGNQQTILKYPQCREENHTTPMQCFIIGMTFTLVW